MARRPRACNLGARDNVLWIMKRSLVFALLFSVTAPVLTTLAAEEDPAPPTNRPNPEALRGRFRNLSPEDREARLRELRMRLGAAGTNRSEIEKRREEWRKLPPAEREARVREFRERNLGNRSPHFNRLTPAERETKRTEIKGRIDAQIKELETRKSTAPLSPLEQRRLERFQQMSRRLEQGTALGFPSRPNRPKREGADLPPPRPNPAGQP